MEKNLDLSIVISNFNTKKLVLRTLISLQHFIESISYEIIVIDDASTDNSYIFLKKRYPKITLIRNKKNLGYSKSYNIGTKHCKGRYILHLNSDISFKKNKLDYFIKYMDQNPKIGIMGCKIIKSNNILDKPCKRSFPTIKNIFFQTTGLAYLFPKSKLFGEYYLSYLDENRIQKVDCLMGAFMLIRRKVIKDIGLLDEQFFIYGEDIDFCYRTKKAGWDIVYNPYLVIQHIHGGTTENTRFLHYYRFHKAMIQYYQKHHANNNSFIVNKIIYSAIIIRMFCVYIKSSSSKLLKKLFNSY